MTGPELYRSAMGKVRAGEDWKQRARAAMEAASSAPAAPRLRVAGNPRRGWKVALAAAACLVLAAIPLVKYGPMLGLDGFGAMGGAAAPNEAAAPETAMVSDEALAQESPAEPRLYSGQEAPAAGATAEAGPVTAIEGLPAGEEPVDAVLTRVGEDETSVYYLAGGLEGVTAVYADGSREPLAEALEAGRVTLADLEALGVELIAEPK